MQKAIQLFEQDFARWGLHVPEADAAARRSGIVHEAGWHVLYDFGQDSRGEFLDYYAALRDATDSAVTDDWHIRLYETGDRVPLPTVLEAYMYARDPTPDELARARRKFTGPQAPAAPPKPASPRPASPQPASVQPTNLQPASLQPANLPAAPRMAAAKPAVPRPAAAPAAGPSPRPAPRPATGAGTPSGMPRPMPGATPRQPAIAASAAPSTSVPRPGSAGAPRSASPVRQTSPTPSTAMAVDHTTVASDDIALEVGLDLALAGVEPMPGGDTLASWLMTPAFGSAMIEPAKASAPAPKPAPSPKPKPAAPADDDAQSSDLVFASEPPPARISDRISNPTAVIATDDDTFTISMSDDDPGENKEPARDSLVAATIEGLDHYHTPTRFSGRTDATSAADALAADALALEAAALPPDDEDAASIPPAERRDTAAPHAMLTTDIAAVAGSFEPWWYRPMTRRIAMLAAAVIAVILMGSAISHFRSSPAPDAARSRPSAPPAAAPDAAADPADAAGASDSAQPGEGAAQDSSSVASTPSSVTADPANPAADDGIARPAGPQSVPPIERSGTGRAPLGSGRTTAKAGSALP